MAKKTSKAVKAVEVGAGIAAGIAGAIAAGYILLEKTKPQQKQAKQWIAKARTEAAHQMKNVQRMSKADYERIMDKALKHYAAVQKVGASELVSAMKDAKAEWKHMQSEGKKVSSAAKKSVKKVATPKKKVVTKKKK